MSSSTPDSILASESIRSTENATKDFRRLSPLSTSKNEHAGNILSASTNLNKLGFAPRSTASPKLLDVLFRRKRLKQLDLDAIATEVSVFDDPLLSAHYFPTPGYENIHRFDPSAKWTYREERAVIRKIDLLIMVWAMVSFSALNLDRYNLSQANSDNILDDLGLTTDNFNTGNSIFRIAFLCAELPSQLISKRIGPDRWIPTQVCLWSVVTMAQFWLQGKTSFFICRALLGFIQGGFIPDLILYLSYFYKKTELPLRFAFFWASSDVTTIVASFLAFFILHMRGIEGKAGWRWLFLIEGFLTLVIGIATFFRMPPSPTQTKTWFRPKGWFTAREEIIMVNRILRDDPTKGDMHNRQGLNLRHLWNVATDYDLYPVYIIGLLFGIPVTPPDTYLTLSLRNLGFSTFHTNLLTIPKTVAHIFTLLGVTLLSELVDSRSLVAMAEDVWTLPCLIALYTLPSKPNPWAYYAIATTLLSFPYTHAIQVAWCSRNAGSVAGRTVNASIYNMFVQASAVISAYIYRDDDKPNYRRGNRALIIISCINILVLYPGTRLYYKWRNSQRDKVWNAKTAQEKAHYLATTKDIGNKRLDFRFSY